ncbi:blood vessel epicardial substance [Diplonema papillatum]|nr:blood vessel epicardial substance [Diplonema papillatum]
MGKLLPVNGWLFQTANTFLFLSYISRNLIALRVCLTCGSIFFALWAYFDLDIALDTIIWNCLFAIFNFLHAMSLIYKSRKVPFGDDLLETAYDEVFCSVGMSRVEFLHLTQSGERFSAEEHPPSAEIDNEKSLAFLLSGEVIIEKKGFAVGLIRPLQFINSPQWLANLHSVPSEPIMLQSDAGYKGLLWSTKALKRAQKDNPQLTAQLVSACSRDVVEKLFASDEAAARLRTESGNLPANTLSSGILTPRNLLDPIPEAVVRQQQNFSEPIEV